MITGNTTDSQKARVSNLLQLIEGFETPLSMELLATVDYVLANEITDKGNLSDVTAKVHQWNERKQRLMPARFVEVAYKRLMQFEPLLYG